MANSDMEKIEVRRRLLRRVVGMIDSEELLKAKKITMEIGKLGITYIIEKETE